MHKLTIHTRNWYTKREKSSGDFLYEKKEDAAKSGWNCVEYFLDPWPRVEMGCSIQRGDCPGGGCWGQVVRNDGTTVFRVEAEVSPFTGRTAPDTAEALEVDFL